jgi:hypothetical protein
MQTKKNLDHKRHITINVTVVYMVRDVLILMGKIHFEGHYWEGWALKIETFLGPEMATSEASVIWAQKIEIFFRSILYCVLFILYFML